MSDMMNELDEKNTLAIAAEVLSKSAQIIGSSLDPQRVMQRILLLLQSDLQMRKGRILTLDEKGVLRIQWAVDMSTQNMARGAYAVGEGVTGQVVKTGKVAWIRDVNAEPAYLARVTDLAEFARPLVAYLAVPIKVNNDIIGVLAVHPAEPQNERFAVNLFVLELLAVMLGQLLLLHEKIQRRTRALEDENRRLKKARGLSGGRTYGLIGKSASFNHAVDEVLKAAATQASVLLTGESGVGKERFAKMIHMAGCRRDGPFIGINCAAIPGNLLESELFGHEKGSFTDAVKTRAGKFELAHGGTLFLDEIGDMPAVLQIKLLRVLQERCFTRLGGQREIHVDVRIIAATHQDLEAAIAQNEFRLDLYYRLNVVNIQLPALRQRAEDIRELAAHFLMRENDINGTQRYFSEQALQKLEAYHWPGNIRQLENIVTRALILSDGNIMDAAFVTRLLKQEQGMSGKPVAPFQPRVVPESMHRQYRYVRTEEKQGIEKALSAYAGNKTLAAKSLGLTTRQLYYRMEKLGIDG